MPGCPAGHSCFNQAMAAAQQRWTLTYKTDGSVTRRVCTTQQECTEALEAARVAGEAIIEDSVEIKRTK